MTGERLQDSTLFLVLHEHPHAASQMRDHGNKYKCLVRCLFKFSVATQEVIRFNRNMWLSVKKKSLKMVYY